MFKQRSDQTTTPGGRCCAARFIEVEPAQAEPPTDLVIEIHDAIRLRVGNSRGAALAAQFVSELDGHNALGGLLRAQQQGGLR